MMLKALMMDLTAGKGIEPLAMDPCGSAGKPSQSRGAQFLRVGTFRHVRRPASPYEFDGKAAAGCRRGVSVAEWNPSRLNRLVRNLARRGPRRSGVRLAGGAFGEACAGIVVDANARKATALRSRLKPLAKLQVLRRSPLEALSSEVVVASKGSAAALTLEPVHARALDGSTVQVANACAAADCCAHVSSAYIAAPFRANNDSGAEMPLVEQQSWHRSGLHGSRQAYGCRPIPMLRRPRSVRVLDVHGHACPSAKARHGGARRG